MPFELAKRVGVWLKIALIGPSGSGKTFSALRLAAGIGEKTALIDTENRRSLYYADKFAFDVLHFAPPFTPERYIQYMRDAYKAGYRTLVIDSASHEWMGTGGCLQAHDAMQGNSFQNWGKITPRHQAFVDAIVASPLNILLTLRGKDEYVIEQNDKGKSAPRKVGVGPQMRDGLEYECTASLLLDVGSHTAMVSKDNTGIFDGTCVLLTEDHGVALKTWANSGGSPAAQPPAGPAAHTTPAAPAPAKTPAAAPQPAAAPAAAAPAPAATTPAAPAPAKPQAAAPAQAPAPGATTKDYNIHGTLYRFTRKMGPCSGCGKNEGKMLMLEDISGACYHCVDTGKHLEGQAAPAQAPAPAAAAPVAAAPGENGPVEDDLPF